MDSHLRGTQALLAALVKPVPIVYISGRSVYGRSQADHLDEKVEAVPVDAYGKAKRAAEMAIENSACPYVMLRCSTLIGFGVDDDGHAFLRQALHQALAGGSVTRYTPDRLHDALDVWAAAQACVILALGER
jgi:nucleoside-diphosphate-sugar epimerase